MLHRLALLALLLVACGEDPSRPSTTHDASTSDAGSREDAAIADAAPPHYDLSCEPSMTTCQAQLDTCAAGADRAAVKLCLVQFSQCYVSTMQATVPCFERFGCTIAIDAIACLPSCESAYQDCVRAAPTPEDEDQCRADDIACGHNCGMSYWRMPDADGFEPHRCR